MPSEVPVPEFVERGYHLAYAKDAGDFRFNVMAILTALAFGMYAATGYDALLVFAAAVGCVAYYFYPLKERKPRIGAGQYGIFIDGFGLISWRAIADIQQVTHATRFSETDELQIRLKTSLDNALLADWRRLPVWRLLMKLPWTMTYDNVVRIPLAPFAEPPETIHWQFVRLWKYYR
ncbi:MAG: hypothetical protein HC850_10685 [Rhodomicrobium sp.]|nr:hypothetical protein [Rhodomicrobium sp.]